MPYLYRVKSIDDFEEYYRIKADKVAVLWSGFASAPDKEKLKTHFQNILNINEIYLYFLKDDETNEVIGYDQLTMLNKDIVESSGHSIKTEYQGKGFGNLIIQLVTLKAAEMGFKRIIAWISENNIGSKKNFENSGFIKKTQNSRINYLEALKREDRFFMWEKKL